MYYESTFSRNKTNIRNTWKTLNEIISISPPKKQCPTFLGMSKMSQVVTAGDFNLDLLKLNENNIVSTFLI